MQMDDAWLMGIREWAAENASIHEVWLFGSRAKGNAGPDSDVDIAVVTSPPYANCPDHNWAWGNAVALHKRWRQELEVIVGRHVSLEPLPFGEDLTDHVDIQLIIWRRDSGMAPTSG